MQSSDSLPALRKNLDFIRFGSIMILLIHFYTTCYPACHAWKVTAPVIDRVIVRIDMLFFMTGVDRPKLTCLLLLAVSLFGEKGKKDEKLTLPPMLYYLFAGLLLFFLSSLFLRLAMDETRLAILYMGVTSLGWLSILSGGARLSRLLRLKFAGDVFNDLNETFPQEERLLQNEFSINLPAQYKLKNKTHRSYINVTSPLRALIVCGTPGSGKSFYVIRHVITQHIQKGFTFFLYDFKFPDLTLIAYNTALKHRDKYPVPPKLYVINFDDLSRSHRCNLLMPDTMLDITDATESSRTIMLALNKQWIQKTGDFFVESPINFITAIFWYLKNYKGGVYCTLPHAIELAQQSYDELFPIMSLEPSCELLLNPFISAYVNGALEQLEGQIASAKIGLARLASPSLYFILSGNDFTLDVNNPAAPKIVCVGNNPSKTQIYGAVISLCTERMLKLVNRKGQLKSSLVFDEFPTIFVNNIDSLIATARGNKVATTLGVQDFSQLRKDYGKEQAEVIMNVCGNIISGQVLGDTAKSISDRIGRIMQERESLSINSNDTSLSKSTQLEAAIPASRIAGLSSGEFVGAVADDPQQKIKLKAFHCEILNDFEAIRREEAAYEELPVIRTVNPEIVQQNYFRIKADIRRLVDSEMQTIKNSAQYRRMLEKKKPGAKGAASF